MAKDANVQPESEAAPEEQKAEEKKVVAAAPEKKPDFDPEAFKAEIEKRFKTEIDGLNRRNSLLEKKLEEAEKEKMSEKERAEYDLKKVREEADKARREAQEFQLERIRLARLYEAGLDEKAAAFVGGGTEEEIQQRVKTLTEFIEARASARVEAEVKKRFDAVGRPGGGDKPGGSLTWDQVQKMSDADLAKLPPEALDQFFKK